jgi:hypothetical protein
MCTGASLRGGVIQVPGWGAMEEPQRGAAMRVQVAEEQPGWILSATRASISRAAEGGSRPRCPLPVHRRCRRCVGFAEAGHRKRRLRLRTAI